MAFDLYSPHMASANPVGDPSVSLPQIPQLQDINSPRQQPFQKITPIDYKPNEVAGTAIKGAGQLLGDGVNVVDQVFKIDIDKDVRSGTDSILNKQIAAGVDTKNQILQDNTDSKASDAPVGVSQGLDRMTTLDKAKRSGAMSDTAFYAQMQDLTSSLKSKYPGFSNAVDDKIKSIVGIDPAEGIRKSLQADNTQLRQDQIARMNKKETFLLSNIADLPQNWQQRSYNDNVETIRQAQSLKSTIAQQAASLANLKADNEDKASKTASYGAWQVTMNAGKMVQAMDQQVQQKLGMSISDVLGSTNLTPQQTKDFGAILRQMQPIYQQTSMGIFNKPLDENDPSNTTPMSLLVRGGKQDMAQKIIQDNDIFGKLSDALQTGDNALIKSYTTTLKNVTDANQAQLLQQNPRLLNLQGLGQILGPNLSQTALGTPEVIGYVSGIFNDAARIANVTDGKPFSDQAKQILSDPNGSDFKGNSKNSSVMWKTLFNDKVTAITGEGVPQAARETNARSIFTDHDPGYLIRSAGPSGMDVFLQLANPKVAKEVGRMPQDVQTGYSNWVTTNFGSLFSRTGDELQSQATNSPYFNIQYNQQSGHFETSPTQEGVKNPNAYQNAIKAVNNPSLTTGVSTLPKLNAGLDIVRPVVENSGRDYNQYVSTLSGGLGLNADQTKKTDRVNNTTSSLNNQRNFRSISAGNDPGTTPPATIPSPTQPLKDLIRRGESSGNYDSIFGTTGAKASSMTVDELIQKQDDMRSKGAKSTAAGGYQVIGSTLKELKSSLNLKGDEKFTPELQEKLADALLEKRGLSDYKAGKLSKYDLVDNLSKEFASLPNMTGKGHYDGDGLNKSNIPLKDLLTTIDKI